MAIDYNDIEDTIKRILADDAGCADYTEIRGSMLIPFELPYNALSWYDFVDRVQEVLADYDTYVTLDHHFRTTSVGRFIEYVQKRAV